MIAHPSSWLALAAAISFVQMALLTPRRSFPATTGLRFVGLGMAAVVGLELPLELAGQWLSGCNQARDVTACAVRGVWPDPLIDELLAVTLVAAAVWVVRAHRSARLSDVIFWAVCYKIGVNFVEESLRRVGELSGRIGVSLYPIGGAADVDRVHAWRFPLTLLPGGFLHASAAAVWPASQGLQPELGVLLMGVVEAVGMWLLLLRRDRWRLLGLLLLALGVAWSTLDHSMLNLYINKASLFGTVVDAMAPNSGLFAFWRHHLMAGHLLRDALLVVAVTSVVVDEAAYCRVHHQTFGSRLAGELGRAWVYLRRRRLLRALRLNQAERRADALAVAPAAGVDDAATAMRRRLLLALRTAPGGAAAGERSWWRRTFGRVRGVRIPPAAWLKLSVRVLAMTASTALLAALSTGRLSALGVTGRPALLWLALGLLAVGIAIGLVDAVQAARRGDGLPLLLAGIGLCAIGTFRVAPVVGHALWHTPIVQGHIPDVFKSFLQAAAGLFGGGLGHALTTLGFGLAAAALGLGALASWWSENVSPQFDSSWVLPALIVLSLLAPMLLPVLLPAELAFLLPAVLWGTRALLLADTLSTLAPHIADAANAYGYSLQGLSYQGIGDQERADQAFTKADDLWSTVNAEVPGDALTLGLNLATGHLGGRLVHAVGRPAEEALADDLRWVPPRTGSRLDREFARQLDQVDPTLGPRGGVEPAVPEATVPEPARPTHEQLTHQPERAQVPGTTRAGQPPPPEPAHFTAEQLTMTKIAQATGQTIADQMSGMPGKLLVDYTTHPIDHRVAVAANNALERIAPRYGHLFQQDEPLFQTIASGDPAFFAKWGLSKSMAAASSGSVAEPPAIYLNPSHFANADTIAAQLKQGKESGLFSIGSTQDIIYHELGHHLEDAVNRLPGGEQGLAAAVERVLDPQAANQLGEEPGWLIALHQDEIRAQLGQYATENWRELIAEGFTRYLTEPNPPPLARAIGQYLDAHLVRFP